MSFLTTSPPLARALAERNYSDPTPVQNAVLEDAAIGRDLLVSSQTGSGKTVAYGLAIGSTLLGEEEAFGRAGQPLALIIAPTRELALQVQRELAWLYKHANARVIACVGGMDPRREAALLDEGAHIVVGTPGRLRDHIERHRLDVSALKAVVLDEADEMLDLGFRDDLEFILKTSPEDRRSLLFSATLPKAIIHLAKSYQNDALRIEVAGDARGHADIEYRAIRVYPKEVELAVVNLLRFHDAACSLVFCNTRNAVRHLEAILLERGFSAVALSGELSQSERNSALQALRDGRAKVCVATDVAARGIDLPGLTLVIHAELPNDPEVMQHRSGRTGRAGNKGTSVLLVPPSRRRKAEMLLGEAKVEAVWAGAPTQEEIRALDQERLLSDPILTGEPGEDDAAMVEALLKGRSAEEIAAALVRVYRSRLPAAEEVGDPNYARDERRPARSRDDYAPREGSRFGEGRENSPRSDGPRKAGPRGDTVWFRLSVGRKDGADPRQLLPMLCRRGKITRDEVGAIRIFDKETKVEIDADVAERFYELAKAVDRDKITIEPVTGEEERRPAKPFAEKASHAPSAYGKPERSRPERHGAEERDARPEARAYEKKPYEKKAYDRQAYEGGEKKPYEGKKKAYEGKSKPFGAKPYDPVSRDREQLSDPNVSFRSGTKPHAEKPYGEKKSFAGKPFGAGKSGGGKAFAGKPFGAKSGPRDGDTRPAGKPFKGKKPRRDDR
ncbi:MAG TPA: DEAD/DEAH box helicase [Bosea sp. (in: a-proteobacteria)]|jgi:ATP-dependent RNA helicase DeaD|uniref:DEAD/DEAH box helicase n=1 Tax=Bosea sp. (in: a-proteobacteria) TaxID=1871050 RepID=UPI002E0F0C11|nr:DEAD/DEAH box helicase [Bosea sp. (in: a-proteobacteria)]